jgi:PAS domain S-box-containing protein
MPTKPIIVPAAEELRRIAEARLRKGSRGRAAKKDDKMSALDSQRLIHELQVYQVELEMQNAELQEARDRMESLLEKYTDLYDFSPAGYFTLGADGHIQLVNLTGARLAGRERSRLVGQSFAELVSSELRPAFAVFLKQVFANDAKGTAEFTLVRRGQPLRSVSIEAQRSPSGRECSAVVVDITERSQAVEKVRVSEIRYRRLFEAAHDGVLLLDPSTRKITDANPFMTTLLGYPHAQLVGKELFEIGLLKDEDASQEMFRNLKKAHQVRYEDLPLESKDGRHQEVEVVANLHQENGHAVIQCNIRDITERKKSEAILYRNEVLFAALIEQAPMGVYVVNARFQMQQVNSSALPQFSQISPLLRRDFAEIIHILWQKKVADQVEARFRHTLKTGEPYQSPEFAERRRDTGMKEVYEWQIQRITLPAGEFGVVCFFNNITQRKKAEETQRRLEVMAASNRKLEQEIVHRREVEASLKQSEQELSRMLGQLRELSRKILFTQEEERKRISRELHDVIAQTLVGINVSLATLALGGSGDPQTLQKNIRRTQRQVEESVDIVHHFAAELRPVVLDNLGLTPALEAFMKSFMADTGVRVTLQVFAGIEQVDEIKRTVLYRIVQEALTNVARHARASRARVSIQRHHDGGILMEVTDDGCGFVVKAGAAVKATKRLGMLGMKERVEMIGGTFTLDSAPGRSTTVRVEIPADGISPKLAPRKKH